MERMGDSDKELDIDELNQFPYIDQVIKETERRFVLQPYSMRIVPEDMKIGRYLCNFKLFLTHNYVLKWIRGTIIKLNLVGMSKEDKTFSLSKSMPCQFCGISNWRLPGWRTFISPQIWKQRGERKRVQILEIGTQFKKTGNNNLVIFWDCIWNTCVRGSQFVFF